MNEQQVTWLNFSEYHNNETDDDEAPTAASASSAAATTVRQRRQCAARLAAEPRWLPSCAGGGSGVNLK